MNFEFSSDAEALRDQATRLLEARGARANARRVMDGIQAFDEGLWSEMGSLGWMGVIVPETYGGAGLGAEFLCVIAEELGRSLASLPYASSIYRAVPAISLAGAEGQKRALLPRLAAGDQIVTLVDATRPNSAQVEGGRLTFDNLLTPDAMIADLFVIAVSEADGAIRHYLIEAGQAGLSRSPCTTVDLTLSHGYLSASDIEAEPLGTRSLAGREYEMLLAQMMVPIAFEELGGASACLEMARKYACERHAFNRPIGSFQAIKHKLARMFVLNELARSNASYAAWALATNADQLCEAAAVARLSSIRAYHFAAQETIEIFGGLGFTWEADCHLYLRRAKYLASAFGGSIVWSERLFKQLETRRQGH